MQRIALSLCRGAATAFFIGSLSVALVCRSAAQELVVTTGTAPNNVRQLAAMVVFPDVSGTPVNPPRNYVTAFDDPQLSTHGLALVAANRALASQITSNTIDVIDTSTATRMDTFVLPDPAPNVHYDGFGTLAANPAKTHVLVLSSLNTLWVVPAPFDHTAAVTMVALPSTASTAQTRAIAFDATGRAFLALQSGIVVLDPPYTSIAFTIPTSNGVNSIVGPITGAVALANDGATLVATRGASSSGYANDVRIFHAPFSAGSVADVLNIPGASLDGLTFTPDGSKLLIVDSMPAVAPALPRVYAVSAPYSSASTVETLAFDPGGARSGFEDIDISADGQLAALSGGSGGNNDPLILLKAPFTAAGFTFVKYAIPGLAFPFDQPGRGDGTAHFWATGIPAQNAQVFVDPSVALSPLSTSGLHVTEGNAGTTDAVIPIELSSPSAQTITVDYTTVDGTAKAADNDYLPTSGTLSFAPGETQKNIVVKVVGDTRYEYDDVFTVVLSNPVNATILGSHPGFSDTATVVIVNDDTVIPLGITTATLPDGVTGVPYSFQVMGGGVTPLTWSASALPTGLTIDAATGIISGTPIFPQTAASPVVVLTDSGGNSASRVYTMNVTGTGIPFIEVSPNPISFGNRAVGSTSSAAGAGIKNSGAVDLVLGNPIVSIPPGSEFALATGFNACAPGQSIAPSSLCLLYFTFTPQATGTRTLSLPVASNAAAATLSLSGVGTSGAAMPVVSIANAASVAEGNSGSTNMMFAVTLSQASASAVTVQYAVSGGSATSGVDFTLGGTGTLTFAPGTTTQNIIVSVIGDTQVEPDESVVLSLSAPSGATLGAASATGIILNDDVAAAPVLALLSSPPHFGDQPLATTSAPVTITLGNVGTSALVLGPGFPGAAGSEFAFVPGTNQCVANENLAPAASCNLYVTFSPIALGPQSASVLLLSNAPTVTLALNALGVSASAPSALQPIPTLSPMSLIVLILLLGAVACSAVSEGGRRRVFDDRRAND